MEKEFREEEEEEIHVKRQKHGGNEDSKISSQPPLSQLSEIIEENILQLAHEKSLVSVDEPTCPRVREVINFHELLSKLRNETAVIDENFNSFDAVFTLSDEITSNITRGIQEDQMLKTKLKVQNKNSVRDLPSFWEVWKRNSNFRRLILGSKDPNEQKWSLCRKFGYKMATNFMPAYAKAIYEYFQRPQVVLDPCAGWGDRLLGAEVAGVAKYIGFDPNLALRPGYSEIMSTCGHQPISLTSTSLQFSNSYEIYSSPFEIGSLELSENSIDFIFTSPPFFDYEMYSNDNPQYTNWLTQFYEPLFIQSARVMKPNGFVCIYIGDTSAGEIENFLQHRVEEICSLKLLSDKKIGFRGIWSGYVRQIWIFQKIVAVVG
jgi:hypothetical protein